MPVLNAVHALLSSANVVTAIYQVTGRDLHGFKRRSNTFQVLRYSQTRIGRSHLPIRLHLFSESQSSTSTFPTVLPIFVFLAGGETSAMTREMNLFFSPGIKVKSLRVDDKLSFLIFDLRYREIYFNFLRHLRNNSRATSSHLPAFPLLPLIHTYTIHTFTRVSLN